MVGGFVKVGEAAEDAVIREAAEETGLSLKRVRQWCMFSQPGRDPRRHTAALVYTARARGTPRAADDAKGIRTLTLSELAHHPPLFAFDHGDIIGAYMARFHNSMVEPVNSTYKATSRTRAIDRACRAHIFV
jgi:8-oxo-dGTP diphosphatase